MAFYFPCELLAPVSDQPFTIMPNFQSRVNPRRNPVRRNPLLLKHPKLIVSTCRVPLDHMGPIIVILAFNVQIQVRLEALDDAHFPSPVNFPPLVESIICIPQANLHSFISLRSGHVHQLVRAHATDIAATTEFLVLGDRPELPSITELERRVCLDNDVMIFNPQVMLVFLGLDDPELPHGGPVKHPVLLRLVAYSFLHIDVSAISSEHHIGEAKNDFIAVLILVLHNPHLIGVVFVDGAELEGVLGVVGLVGSFEGELALLVHEQICLTRIKLLLHDDYLIIISYLPVCGKIKGQSRHSYQY